MKNMNLNNKFFAALLVGAALFAASCTMYDNFDEDLVIAHIEKDSPKDELSSSSGEEKSSSSVAESSSSEKVESSSTEDVKSSSSEGCPESFVDERDDSEYKVVEIFDKTSKTSRCWFGKNLEYEQAGSVCFDKDDDNCLDYGRLYRGDQLNNTGKKAACPEGTHILSIEDLRHFVSAYSLSKDCKGDDIYSCTDGGLYMKEPREWENFNGNDMSGLAMLPGGSFDGTTFARLSESGVWWLQDENADGGFSGFELDDDHDDFVIGDITEEDLEDTYYSVRCVID